ncbi:ABC transporter ATP-binding protein [Lachnospiraceae bacterium LCP25S3_G4]
MTKLFKYLKGSTGVIFAILCILIVQAYCDLSLPGYTSDIVNVGIQQGGIDTSVPKQIRKSELDKLLLFVKESQQHIVKSAYEKSEKSEGNYDLKERILTDETKLEELTDILGKPMVIVSGLDGDSKQSQKMKEQFMTGIGSLQNSGSSSDIQGAQAQQVQNDMSIFEILKLMPEEQRVQVITQIDQQFDDMPETMIEQAATTYIKSEYKALGMDTEKIQNSYIFNTGLKMILLAFLGMIASVIVGFLSARVGSSISRDLRSKVFKKVVGFSSNEFDQFSTASLITRSTNDIQQIQMLIIMMLRMVLYAPILGIGGILKVFKTNANMSWIIGLAVALILIVVITLFTVVMPKFKLVQKLVDRLNLVTREILTGLSVIRAFSTEVHEEERFDKANKDLTKTNLFVNRAMTFMMPTMMLIMNGITVLIVWAGAHGVDSGSMQVGDMMAFIQYAMQIIMSFLMLCMISIMLPRASVSAVRVDEVLTSKTLIHDIQNPKKIGDKKGYVEFDHVCFRYPEADEEILHDISFTAKPGETTAFIGSTGSGKSTLINLIPRFYDVTEGSIKIDGCDIREIAQHDLREQLGYVPQKGVLFSGTISSNIAYGNGNATEEEIKGAASIAQATDFINEKPEKYESYISQGGANVSGGQKQRLSIARAIAKNPKVFIFDDSFSALDYKTDVTLRKALKKKTSDSTVLIVAQRISTILHAEQIIVLDEGVIAGKGTHEELLKTCDVYRQIAMSQLSEAELAEYIDVEKEGQQHE